MASPPSLRDACLKASSCAMPGAEVVLDVRVEVAVQFVGEVAVRLPPAEQSADASEPRAQGCHRALGLRRFVGREEPREDGLRLLPVARFAGDLLLARRA